MKPTPILVTTDVVLFGKKNDQKSAAVLLIQRKNPPFKNAWALPGGFVDPGEDLPEAAARELMEETSVAINDLQQIAAFGHPDRDERGRVVTIAFSASIEMEKVQPKAADDAKNAKWFLLSDLPELAFDHAEIIQAALHLQS